MCLFVTGLFHLALMSSRFIHVVAEATISFLFQVSNIPLCVCFHSSTDGHRWFPLLCIFLNKEKIIYTEEEGHLGNGEFDLGASRALPALRKDRSTGQLSP